MKNLTKLVLSALFMALGIVMPFLTMQIPAVGSMLLPMHIPVLICGFICGWKYGLVVGFTVPLIRSLWLGMPPILTAIAMAFELATYGAITGACYKKLPKSKISIYASLIIAMIFGRLVWGVVSIVIYGVGGTLFTLKMFLAGALLNAIPGIILQIVLVPILVAALEKAGVMKLND